MDSNHSGSKKGLEVMSFQNQDADMSSTINEGGNGTEVKRIKQELHPLRMGVVLEEIFSNLDVESIKNARQVNPLWSVEGAKMLITKCYMKVPSEIHDEDFGSKFKAMDELKAFLSHKSMDFSTIPNITVDRVDDVEAWKYLGVLEQVKSLKFNNIPTENEFFKHLLDLLPNLKYLRFEELDYQRRFINALTSVMTTPEKACKLLVISFLYLRPGSLEQLEDLEKFSSCKNIMIEKLKIEMDFEFLHYFSEFVARVAKVMSNLLSRNQNVLKELTMEDCDTILPILKFPRMTKLTHLDLIFHLETYNELISCNFSPTFRFSEKVPNLQGVRLYMGRIQNYTRYCFINLFEKAGIAPSVKRVSCWGSTSDFDIYHIFKTFPNLENFGTDINHYFQPTLRALWNHGTKLKELRLDVNLSTPFVRFNDLDGIFTGLAFWAVREIKKTPNLDHFTLEELQKLRVDASILNLKNLERFKIRFHRVNELNLPERVLTVAVKYAFQQLPKNPEVLIQLKSGSMEVFNDVSQFPNVKVERSG